ncbi:MAG TPA: TIM barrel protein, partial [Spirochaetia bacterium]|nr:TIM barrel protein [Spirochaetia bacterium]
MSMKQGTGGRRLDLRIATMSLIWGMLEPGNISKWLRESAEAGYDGVTGFESDFSPYLDDHELLADTLREHGLALAGVDWRMNEDEKLYRRYFELMKALDCALFVCIDPAGPKAAAGGAKDYAKLARSLNRVGSVAREYGITVHYHNHTAAVGETLTDMERLIDETDPELVGIMLDLGHATKDFTELAPPERAVRFLEQY